MLLSRVGLLVFLLAQLVASQGIYNQCIANDMLGFDDFNFYDDPTNVPLTYCDEFSGNSCCTMEYSDLIGDFADPYSLSFLALLSEPTSACREMLEDISCIMCSTAQADWIYTSPTLSSLVMCQSYCEDLYNHCNGVVTVHGSTVGNEFDSPELFCTALFGQVSSSDTPVKVLLDQHNRDCWDNLPECTEDSYYPIYTDCVDGRRNMIWVKKPEVECKGGFDSPQNLQDQPCALACESGQHSSGSTCVDCAAGTYSLGGSILEDTWSIWDDLFLPFSTYCTWTDSYGVERMWTEGGCDGWELGFNEIASPVALNNSMTAYLETSVTLLQPGQLTFTAKIDSEHNFDGLIVAVDRIPSELGFLSHVVTFETYTIDLDAGYHFLQFAYSKDISISRGLDQAIITSMEITNVNYASETCTPCHAGSYSGVHASSCSLCPLNTYAANTGATRCEDCPGGMFAYEGSSECSGQADCTEDSYYFTFGPCYFDEARNGPTREYRANWVDPHVCAGVLPETQYVDCSPCEPGSFRDEDGVGCTFCPDGTYSRGDNTPCTTCRAGAEAIKQITFDEFNAFENGLTTTCAFDCGTDGWVMREDYIDSGTGHGTYVVSSLIFNQTFTEPGSIHFQFTLSCVSDCLFTFESDADLSYRATGPSTWYRNVDVAYSVPAGSYGFLWQFTRGDGSEEARDDKVQINFISATHTAIGGAKTCENCAAGYYNPAEGASDCIPSPPGYYSQSNATEPLPCEGNTYSAEEGSSHCTSCGENILSNVDHTDCDITCQYEDIEHTYNLSDLARYDSEMYGPVWDATNQTYYLNMCTKTHNGHTCFDIHNDPLETFACQVSDIGLGLDLGNTFGILPLREGFSMYTTGVTIHLDHGSACHNGSVYFDRQAYIDVICDPSAGVGQPLPKYDNVESQKCVYEFEWASLYGCPICEEEDYHYFASECDEYGMQTLTYDWNENPKPCHGGVSLPTPTSVPCGNSVYCGPGEYFNLNTDACALAPAGFYSVGNGFKVSSWESELSPGFTNNGWIISGDYIQSGEGDTSLLYVQNFVTAGTIKFTYSVNNYGDSTAGFSVYVDDVQQGTEVFTTTNQYRTMTLQITSGYHYVKFEFEGGSLTTSESQARAVRIQEITVLGTQWAAMYPLPCQAGTISAEGAVLCEDCPWNTSSGDAAEYCLPCDEDKYAFPGSGECTEKEPCGLADYRLSYGPCVDGQQTNEYVLLEPVICYEEAPPQPMEDSVDCFPCEEGMYRVDGSDECETCEIGQYWSGSKCKSAKPGYAGILLTSYFVNPMVGDVLPDEFSTGCSGDCFCRNTNQCSDGWRIHSGFVDSGMNNNREVDVYLDLTLELVTDGSITFLYEVTGPSSNGLEFYINEKQYSAPYHPSGSTKSISTISFEVESGLNVFRWNYHQEPDTTGSISLSSIVIEGLGGSIGETKCAPGEYSEDTGASVCTPCPPGTSTSEDGSTGCNVCPSDSYAMDAGFSECYPCGEGTIANSGRTDCETDCIFVFQNSTYDLSALQNTHGPFPLTDLTGIWMNICEKRSSRSFCLDPYGESISTYMCEVDTRGNGIDYGNHLSVDLVQVEDDKKKASTTSAVRFSYSVVGDPDNQCESTVTVVCDPDSSFTNPYLLDDPSDCSIHMRWDSSHGCPVCNEEVDYFQQESECNDGEKTITTMRINNCDGPAILRIETETCPTRYSISLAVILVVAVIVLLLLLVVVAVVVYNRRLSNQYTALIRDSEGQYEMKQMEDSEVSDITVDKDEV